MFLILRAGGTWPWMGRERWEWWSRPWRTEEESVILHNYRNYKLHLCKGNMGVTWSGQTMNHTMNEWILPWIISIGQTINNIQYSLIWIRVLLKTRNDGNSRHLLFELQWATDNGKKKSLTYCLGYSFCLVVCSIVLNPKSQSCFQPNLCWSWQCDFFQ